MEAAILNNDYFPELPLKQVLESFFLNNTPEKVKYLFWRLLQCYVTKDCNKKTEVPDQEVALFYDQLLELVAAAYILHQESKVQLNPNEGKAHG